MLAGRARKAGAVVAILGDAPALRADDLRLGLFFRISVLREDVAAKQRDGFAIGNANRLHPEKIQNRDRRSGGRVRGLVVAPDSGSDAVLQMGERVTKRTLGNARKRLPHKEGADRVAVAADHVCSQLERFAQGCAAAHERIEYGFSAEVVATVEGIPYPCAFRAECAKRNRPENRAQPCRPPFMDMVERPVYLLAPALMLRHLADFQDWEVVLKGGLLTLVGKS